MRRHGLLVPALWVAFSHASPHLDIRVNASSSSSQSSATITDYSTILIAQSSYLSSNPLSSGTPTNLSPTGPRTSGSRSNSNSTTITLAPAPTICTGCVLEAISPTTLSWNSSRTLWESTEVTETILTQTITYMDGTTIDTVVTEYETLTQNHTIVLDSNNETVVHTTPVFTWVPADGTTVTLDIGPTYVAYTSIYGGPDSAVTVWPKDEIIGTGGLVEEVPEITCIPRIRPLKVLPTQTEDYHFFIQTYTHKAPTAAPNKPLSLPSALIEHLKSVANISSIFNGSDIATCTLAPLPSPSKTFISTEPMSQPAETPPPLFIPTTRTYISKTYESTSTHITRQGCLRCSPPEDPEVSLGGIPTDPPKPPQSQVQPPDRQRPEVTDLPGLIVSVINDPAFKASDSQGQPNGNTQRVTIGDGTFQIRPIQPTQPNNPNQQRPQNPGVVVGSKTLTPGQTTTMNGVEVVVPTQGGGSNILVGGSTIRVNPAPTPGPPVLTAGDRTVTANRQGEFVLGTQTLTPGGSPITVDGSTLSLGPGGTIAVVNGITQTLGNAPLATGPPVLTVNGQAVSATVLGGTTQFVLGQGQTLTPGGVLIVAGTTFSLPADSLGSVVVVNGVTSTLESPGLPVITLDSQSVTASVIGGTTAFVLGPDQTLTPGGVIVVSGTTFSMPVSGSGSVVVINGVTSTLGQPLVTAAAALTINGNTYSATVRDGTTEYVLGEGTTLKPGEAVTISGTTYSLDAKGTALVINGKTSSLPTGPASNSASTTRSTSTSESTTSPRQPGDFVASGIGITDKKGGAIPVKGGLDKWVEGIIIGIAGWLVMLV